MTSELIDKFIKSKPKKNTRINIHFKQRATLKGVFIQSKDYDELRAKNFWRFVPDARLAEWEKTGDNDLARIFNGAEFTKLSENN